MRRSLLVVALLVPLAVLVFAIAQAERHLATSRVFVFDVEGFDPRDLLRGHFIQFRLRFDEDEPLEVCEDGAERACCLCLISRGVDAPPRVRRASCERAAAECDGRLQTRFLPELSRYYIPEADAAELEQRFGEAARAGTARLRVAIDVDGRPQIESLRIGDEEIRANR
jgi:uncharacterized membrane-anchored protein